MRPSYLKINLANLRHNFKTIRKFCPNSKIMAAVKANAYGHGLIECTKALEEENIDYFGVAFIEEAIELRESGIKTPILTLGGISGRQVDLFLDYKIDILASSVTKLEQIEQSAKARGIVANIHVKIDTGMERIGIHHYSDAVSEIIKKSTGSDFLNLIGICSHFATSEEQDSHFIEKQRERFISCLDKHSSLLPKGVIKHIANSGGVLSSTKNHFDMIRPGKMLYGIKVSEHLNNILDLRPCLELISEVAYFKVVRKGDSVSYGQTWTAQCDTRVVTIPVGYGDGIPRSLSNKGSVIIRGKRYPIIGNICMDQFMVDIGPNGEAYNGDQVIIVGKDISIYEIAELISAEPLEVLTHLNTRLPRVYVN